MLNYKYIDYVKMMNYVDCEGNNLKNDVELFKLLGAIKSYLFWTVMCNARPGDRVYEQYIDDAMREDKGDMRSAAANAVVRMVINMGLAQTFFKRRNNTFIDRYEVAEEALRICEDYGVSLKRNFYALSHKK